MINEAQIEVIRKYVPEKYFYQDRLIKYLSMHDMVGIEVFEYVAKKIYDGHAHHYETVLPVMFEAREPRVIEMDDEGKYGKEDEYVPESVDVFVKRIPFNFYHVGDDIRVDENGKEIQVWRPVAITDLTYAVGHEPMSDYLSHRDTVLTLEHAYEILEYLFYEKGYLLEEIFSYCDNMESCLASDLYPDWFDYVDMCRELGWDDLLPSHFYYKYNLAKETLGKAPIKFPIVEFDCEAWKDRRDQVQFYRRMGDKIEMYGMFPCDENDIPVLRWIDIDIKNAANVTSKKINGLECRMVVELTPRTVIHAMIMPRDEIGNPLPDAMPERVQIYAGPQTMQFNYKLLKQRRNELGYTQQQVADAVEANIRTYQKWENGETKPDGYYLLRIMNWLDIPSINDVIIYCE